jgi:cardiolipin synthase A/B
VATLLNGDQIFPAMLEAIESAQRSITFETYIYWAGEIGERFAKALSERASAGVEVRVIIDWFGAQGIDPKYLEQMKSAGVDFNLYHDVPWYNPLRWSDLADVEHRTHRKILVVDGKVGFTGGVGIADIWTRKCRVARTLAGHSLSGERAGRRLTTVRIRRQLARIRRRVTPWRQVFPELRATGSYPAQPFKGSPEEATENVELMYRLAIAAAEHSVSDSRSGDTAAGRADLAA